MIMTWDPSYTDAVIALWNKEAVKEGYKELSPQSFDEIFASNPYFGSENTFILLENGGVTGFACGCTGDDLPLGEQAGYITCIVLANGSQTDDNYSRLLASLEGRFQQVGKKQSDVLFFNPMRLPWYIPNTPNHEHNNAPGVPVGSPMYHQLLNHGYVERAQQCAMYLNLDGFTISDDVRSKEAKAAEDGYSVVLFDTTKHVGVSEMLEGLNNPLWQQEIGQATATGGPVVVAVYRGTVVGFAGPVIRQENGRGYFSGIGVLPEHEGHGLGSILFFKLCEAFRQIGTDYMSLYTGMSNPAIRIYERAGFQTVKLFAVMRKEIV